MIDLALNTMQQYHGRRSTFAVPYWTTKLQQFATLVVLAMALSMQGCDARAVLASPAKERVPVTTTEDFRLPVELGGGRRENTPQSIRTAAINSAADRDNALWGDAEEEKDSGVPYPMEAMQGVAVENGGHGFRREKTTRKQSLGVEGGKQQRPWMVALTRNRYDTLAYNIF